MGLKPIATNCASGTPFGLPAPNFARAAHCIRACAGWRLYCAIGCAVGFALCACVACTVVAVACAIGQRLAVVVLAVLFCFGVFAIFAPLLVFVVFAVVVLLTLAMLTTFCPFGRCCLRPPTR